MPDPPLSPDLNFLTNSLFSIFLKNVIVRNNVLPSDREDPSETLEQKWISKNGHIAAHKTLITKTRTLHL